MTSGALTVSRQVPADDTGMPGFTEGLHQLAAAVQAQARLTPAGLRAARRNWASLLATQLQVRSMLRREPAIGSVTIDRPIFVTGAHRSGTTLLQRLLARHPRLHAPALWEQLAPASQRTQAELVRRAQRYVEGYYRLVPALPDIHHLDAYQPDECHRLLGVTFRSEIFELRHRVPAYGQWLRTQDTVVAYRFHRTLLRCLSWRRPATRLVLKCPFHVSHLDSLAAVYPDAVVVRLHRDPVETVPSGCSLIASIRGAWSDRVDPIEIGRFWLARSETLLNRPAGGGQPAPLPILHLRYPDLVRDPIATAAAVCEFAAVPTDERARERMAHHLADEPPRRRGQHRYRPADFGLCRDDLEHRFASYRAEFDL